MRFISPQPDYRQAGRFHGCPRCRMSVLARSGILFPKWMELIFLSCLCFSSLPRLPFFFPLVALNDNKRKPLSLFGHLTKQIDISPKVCHLPSTPMLATLPHRPVMQCFIKSRKAQIQRHQSQTLTMSSEGVAGFIGI